MHTTAMSTNLIRDRVALRRPSPHLHRPIVRIRGIGGIKEGLATEPRIGMLHQRNIP
jgi:hypothetical protein